MWIQCLAEGQKYWATVGIEPRLSAWESSDLTTIPRHHDDDVDDVDNNNDIDLTKNEYVG